MKNREELLADIALSFAEIDVILEMMISDLEKLTPQKINESGGE